MRVLLLGPYPPPWGGVQTNVVALRDYLREQGVPCAVINLTRHRQEDRDDLYFPTTPVQVLRLLLRLRYDVIHLHIGGDLSTRLLLLGVMCSMLPWAKVVLTFHSGGYPTSPEGRTARPRTLRGFALRRLDRQIAVNAQLVELFRRFGCAPEKVRLIPPHAVPQQTLESLTSVRLPPELSAFADQHSPLIVSVSGLEQEYDLPLQLQALERVRRDYPAAGLVVAGSGRLEQELRARIAGTPHGAHMLLAGDLPHAVTLALVARSAVSLRTTWFDGDAISVREALWLGTPVIATDNGMRPAGVRLVPVGDLDALSAAIHAELSQPHRTAAPAARTQDGQENLASTLELYRELAGASTRAQLSAG